MASRNAALCSGRTSVTYTAEEDEWAAVRAVMDPEENSGRGMTAHVWWWKREMRRLRFLAPLGARGQRGARRTIRAAREGWAT